MTPTTGKAGYVAQAETTLPINQLSAMVDAQKQSKAAA